MSLRTHVEQRIAPTQRTARYLRTSDASVRYLGWLGQRNLGDEAVHQAVQHYLEPHELAWRPEQMPPALGGRAARRTHALTMLGGGTLLGGRYIDDFVAEPDPAKRVVFGSGVIDPSFPHSYRNGTESLDRWVEAIDGIAVLGVRGPLSKQILHDRGIDVPILGDPVAAFAQPAGHWQPNHDHAPVLGVNIGQSAGGMFSSELDMLKHAADAVRLFVERGWTIEYFVVWPEDLAITKIFARDVGTRDATIHRIYDHATDFVSAARHLHGFVGLKLHAVALAACAGVPSASIAYQPKCIDFLASLNLADLAVRTDAMANGQLVNVINRLVDNGEAISTAAQSTLMDLQAKQREAAKVLTTLLAT